ncbi:MAG: hypothetical protein MHPSP_004258, partial [Paramarteilia canceri]
NGKKLIFAQDNQPNTDVDESPQFEKSSKTQQNGQSSTNDEELYEPMASLSGMKNEGFKSNVEKFSIEESESTLI